MKYVVVTGVVGVIVVTSLTASRTQAQQVAPRSGSRAVYSAAQAGQGKAIYEKKCTECHGAVDATTPDMAALLGDHVFRKKWTDRSLAELFELIHETMPQNAPRSLSPEEVCAVIAHILSANGFPAGNTNLSPKVEVLKELRWEPVLP